MTSSEIYFDPFDLDIKTNPYDLYRRLRDEAPLYYNDRHDFFVVSRFADVERVLTERETFISSKGGTIDVIKAGYPSPPGLFINEDPPHHARHRSIVSLLFTPRAVSSLEPKVRDLCATTFDALVGSGGFDFVAEIGAQIPMRVIGMLLGIPEKDQVMLRDYFEETLQATYDADAEPFAGQRGIEQVFGDYIDWKAKNPGNDLMSELMLREFDDETGTKRVLRREELLTYLILVASAGNDTTNRLIGSMGQVLGDNPEQRHRIVDDRSLVNNAVEEVLRLEPPPYHIARFVAEDVEIHGQTVPAGSAIMTLPGAANRDERMFDDPDTCDVGRDIGHVLSFGFGPHFCMGAALARLEARVVLDEVVQRFPDWEVDHDKARVTPGYMTRGWETLPITVP
jgi:cytochrome P450